MPTLIELPEIEDCAALSNLSWLAICGAEYESPFISRTVSLDTNRLEAAAKRYGIYFTIHLDENLNVSDFANPFCQLRPYTLATVLEAIKHCTAEYPSTQYGNLSEGVYFYASDRENISVSSNTGKTIFTRASCFSGILRE